MRRNNLLNNEIMKQVEDSILKVHKKHGYKKVATLKSFYVDGKMKHSKYTSTVKDVEKLFDNAVSDAKLLAKNAKGSVTVQRTKTTLYINYLDVPKSALVDVTRIVI